MNDTSTVVIFGASGDLTRRKLIPALFNLFCKDRLPRNWQIMGVARTEWSDDEFRERMESGIKQFAPEKWDPDEWAEFCRNLHYQPGDLGKVEDFEALDERLAIKEKANGGAANRVYYLALAPRLYESTIENL